MFVCLFVCVSVTLKVYYDQLFFHSQLNFFNQFFFSFLTLFGNFLELNTSFFWYCNDFSYYGIALEGVLITFNCITFFFATVFILENSKVTRFFFLIWFCMKVESEKILLLQRGGTACRSLLPSTPYNKTEMKLCNDICE